ncbi:hypothetical protein [Embleya sp. NPDC005971]
MEMLVVMADFVKAHGGEMSVGLGALRLALDTARGIRLVHRRRRRDIAR